jgi:hypothetical protein
MDDGGTRTSNLVMLELRCLKNTKHLLSGFLPAEN